MPSFYPKPGTMEHARNPRAFEKGAWHQLLNPIYVHTASCTHTYTWICTHISLDIGLIMNMDNVGMNKWLLFYRINSSYISNNEEEKLIDIPRRHPLITKSKSLIEKFPHWFRLSEWTNYFVICSDGKFHWYEEQREKLLISLPRKRQRNIIGI